MTSAPRLAPAPRRGGDSPAETAFGTVAAASWEAVGAHLLQRRCLRRPSLPCRASGLRRPLAFLARSPERLWAPLCAPLSGSLQAPSGSDSHAWNCR